MSMRALVAIAAIVALTTPQRVANAQARGAAPLSVTLAPMGQTVPDAFSSRCGGENFGSVGGGVTAGLLRRLGRGFGVQADVQMLFGTMGMGCDLVGYARSISPTEYETRSSPDFPDALPHRRYASTTFRAVYEVRRWAPVLRATVGGGALWARQPVPMGVTSLGLAARGGPMRAFGEIEYAVSRVSASERRERFGVDPTTGRRSSLGVTLVPLTRTPRWTTLRAGVEIPIGTR